MSKRTRSSFLGVLAAIATIAALTASGGHALTAARVDVGRVFGPRIPVAADQPTQQPAVRDETMTRLADGRWLIVGGVTNDGPVTAALVIDPRTGTRTPLAGLQVARSAHTATLLADGTVLIAGGRGLGDQIVSTAEIFDPQSNTFLPMTIAGAQPRLDHTATLLTDGRVLIAGGAGVDSARADAEIWNVREGIASATHGALTRPRAQHAAELLADGRVRLSRGVGADGLRIADEELFDPATGVFIVAPRVQEDRSAPRLVTSIPVNGAMEVPLDVRVALRFSHALVADTVTAAAFVLTGPDGPLEMTLVPAEQGRLVFVIPRLALAPDTTYVLAIDGATDRRGVPIVSTSITLTTKASERAGDIPDAEAWTPDGHGWKSNRPDSAWKSLKPLEAPAGVTALAGQVLRLDGLPLPDVMLTLEGRTTRTDRTGRFLLLIDGVTTGEHTFAIDARTANRPNRTYGFYEVRWRLTAGRTNVLPFTIWSPTLDTAHAVTIAAPTTQETVVTTPTMPGLELHLPAGTTILDENHNVVRSITMTPIPLDRTPFPLPEDAMFTMFFTIQPGGAYLRTTGSSKGAWLVYPRSTNHTNGARLRFFNYDPDDKGWFPYGLGTVMPTRVVPDATTRFYAFTGASFDSGPTPPSGGATPGGGKEGDPVDPSTGAFIMEKTDLFLPDVMPLALTRTYNSMDNDPANIRPLGIGMTHAYTLFQWSSAQIPFSEGDLILPDGGRIHYTRTSDEDDPWQTTVMECQSMPTPFYKSQLRFDGSGWEYTLKDGTQYLLGHSAGLQKIRDRYGNEIRLTYAQTNFFGFGVGNLLRITSPNGRWIQFTYDTNSPVNRITDATDNIGRNVHYTYDGNGHLETVTDPEGNVTTYTWDANHRMKTIKDGRNIVYLTNEYDANGRVSKQTLADPAAFYTFTYTTDGGGNITQTEVRNPRGFMKRLSFNSSRYLTSETEAVDEPEQRTITIARLPGSNLVNWLVDGLLRRTEYTYDDSGHVLTVKRLADTPNPVTTTFTYEPKFFQVATVTDQLNHTWTTTYDDIGLIKIASDPLGHEVTFTANLQGLVTSVTDPMQHTWQLGYTGADLTSIIDPMGQTWRSLTDGAGRMLSTTDPLGRMIQVTPDKLGRVQARIDALGDQTSFTYDANGNLLSITDALSHSTSYTYGNSDRVATRLDPLTQASRYFYDTSHNLEQMVDRKGNVTTYDYDSLDRLTRVTYADGSITVYQYDSGDRLRQLVDSISGTITQDYDLLDRLTSVVTPEGTISYTYDADGRRETMTVMGQPPITYGYDVAHQLASITRGASVLNFTYDAEGRRETLTFPNGIVASYSYDNANELTSLTYVMGQSLVGDLTYTYDASQRRGMSGTLARTDLPRAVNSADYDAANRLQTWAARAITYDVDGNITSDGLTTYHWNARGQLESIEGGVSAGFQYDALGRRTSRMMGSSTTSFLYDGVNIVQELSGGVPLASIVSALGPDEVFLRMDSIGQRTVLPDALGSTVTITDAAGELRTSYIYEPFGATQTTGEQNTNSTAFTGREDDRTGLYYYRSRYYMPEVHRFASEDPVGFGGGDVNLYTYVMNQPTLLSDWSGLAVMSLPSLCRSAGRKDSPRSALVSFIIDMLCEPSIPFPTPLMAGAGGAGSAAAAAGRKAAAAGRSAAAAAARRAAEAGSRELGREAEKMKRAVEELKELLEELANAAGKKRGPLQEQIAELASDIWGHIKEIGKRPW